MTLPGWGWEAMARGTTFAYRDAPSDPRRIGKELGVGYVVEGVEGDGGRRPVWLWSMRRPAGGSGPSATTARPRTCSRSRTSWRCASRPRSAAPSTAIAWLGAAQASGEFELFDLFQLAGEELDKSTPEANAQAIELLQRAIELIRPEPTPMYVSPGPTTSRSTTAGRPTTRPWRAGSMRRARRCSSTRRTPGPDTCWHNAIATATRCASGGARCSTWPTWRNATSGSCPSWVRSTCP